MLIFSSIGSRALQSHHRLPFTTEMKSKQNAIIGIAMCNRSAYADTTHTHNSIAMCVFSICSDFPKKSVARAHTDTAREINKLSDTKMIKIDKLQRTKNNQLQPHARHNAKLCTRLKHL